MILMSGISFIIYFLDGQLEASVENLAFCAGLPSHLIKVNYIVFYRRKKIFAVIDKLDEIFPHHGFDQHIFGTRKYLKELKVITWIVCIVYFLTMAQISCIVLEHAIYCWFKSEDFQLSLVLNFWFPFDASRLIFFIPLYIVEAFYLVVQTLILISTDLLYAGLLMLTSMQFDILAKKISEAEDVEELKELIKIHEELIEVVKKLEKIFSPLLLVSILTTIFVCCSEAFLVANFESYFLMLKFGGGLFTGMVYGFVACYFGQKLTNSSESIVFAAYDTPWYEKDLKFKKQLLIIMIKASEGEKLTAWKFFGVSMKTYYWILQKSYSYYSFLQRMHTSDDHSRDH